LDTTAASLDTLCEKSLAGDPRAQGALFEALRVRFLPIAKRRVQSDHVEDVVQDTLKIVFDRYGDRNQGAGILVWGLTVLRNVIGNHYQSRDREREKVDFVDEYPAAASLDPDMLAGTVAEETRNQVQQAVAELADRFPRCGRIFKALLASLEKGGSPNQISSRAMTAAQKKEPGLSRGSYYTALHRCRAQLRQIMDRLGDDFGNPEGANNVQAR
jgi:DNA-directed RNA polymerase specialized sigma24 family protein